MIDMLFSFIYLAFSAVLVGSIFWGMLRLMDKAARIPFKRVIDEIETNPLAMALYFGARIIAVAILFSPLLRVLL